MIFLKYICEYIYLKVTKTLLLNILLKIAKMQVRVSSKTPVMGVDLLIPNGGLAIPERNKSSFTPLFDCNSKLIRYD